MRLDVNAFRYITKDEFRVLTAVEMGMRNHEHVPVPLIESIAKLSRGSSYKVLQTLLRNKLVSHDCKKYDGYRMTYHGYDFLALRTLVMRGTITAVGRRLGVGKESDVHYCKGPKGELYAIKLHRLGRISFRNIKEKRDYLQHRTHGSWMYMARLAALKEFAYMKALNDEGFPVPTPIDQNRHCVVMSFIDGVPLYNMRSLKQPGVVLERLMRLIVRLARAGIIHGDFNEFNLMVTRDEKIKLIDFPQIIHTKHPNAHDHFSRDVSSTCAFFRKRLGIEVEEFPRFEEVMAQIAEAGDGALANELTVDGMRPGESDLLVDAHRDGGLLGGGETGDAGCNDDDSESGDEDGNDRLAEEEHKSSPDNRNLAPEDEHTGEIEAEVNLVPAEGREALGEDLGPDAEQAAEADLDFIIEPSFKTKTRNPKNANPTEDEEAQDRAMRQGLYPLEGLPRKKELDEEDVGDEEEEASEGEEDEQAPGQVTIESTGKKVRRSKTSASEARNNLKKQQKARPAKPNSAKNKELRKGRNEVKEYLG